MLHDSLHVKILDNTNKCVVAENRSLMSEDSGKRVERVYQGIQENSGGVINVYYLNFHGRFM